MAFAGFVLSIANRPLPALGMILIWIRRCFSLSKWVWHQPVPIQVLLAHRVHFLVIPWHLSQSKLLRKCKTWLIKNENFIDNIQLHNILQVEFSTRLGSCPMQSALGIRHDWTLERESHSFEGLLETIDICPSNAWSCATDGMPWYAWSRPGWVPSLLVAWSHRPPFVCWVLLESVAVESLRAWSDCPTGLSHSTTDPAATWTHFWWHPRCAKNSLCSGWLSLNQSSLTSRPKCSKNSAWCLCEPSEMVKVVSHWRILRYIATPSYATTGPCAKTCLLDGTTLCWLFLVEVLRRFHRNWPIDCKVSYAVCHSSAKRLHTVGCYRIFHMVCNGRPNAATTWISWVETYRIHPK